MNLWLVLWCVLALAACTTERMIGSACEEGMCEGAAATPRIPCLIATGSPAVASSLSSFSEICLMQSVHKDDEDTSPCRMLYSSTEAILACADYGFREAPDYVSMSSPVCEIPQLARGERDTKLVASGWYLEGPPLPTDDDCSESRALQHAHLNGVLPAVGVTWLRCAEAFADAPSVSPALRTGDAVLRVDPESCSSLPPLPSRVPTDIGSVCAPRVEPPEGFYTDRTYLDVRSEQCETGVCLIDATASPDTWPCPEGSECDKPDLADFMYCSCRCQAGGDLSRAECQCPSGYSCHATAIGPEAPASLAGGYCMRDGF